MFGSSTSRLALRATLLLLPILLFAARSDASSVTVRLTNQTNKTLDFVARASSGTWDQIPPSRIAPGGIASWKCSAALAALSGTVTYRSEPAAQNWVFSWDTSGESFHGAIPPPFRLNISHSKIPRFPTGSDYTVDILLADTAPTAVGTDASLANRLTMQVGADPVLMVQSVEGFAVQSKPRPGSGEISIVMPYAPINAITFLNWVQSARSTPLQKNVEVADHDNSGRPVQRFLLKNCTAIGLSLPSLDSKHSGALTMTLHLDWESIEMH
ncbi:MAG: hypothetical protein HYR64_01890 [Fimbriimonas ginsengisoli]|uniref:Uncharacterized protein n=1 Tax=Fimbriimonas ginsengisoli TaxID=1005039 RepID=A0A931LUB7_FIMGI|nr:hypothetical protein [Fimbriimonas ginsengisoli]